MPTKTDRLSVEQRNAIDLLVLGQSDADVAERVGVTRQTVCDWRNHHIAFQAALNRRRLEIWAGSADRLRGLVERAIDALAEGLDAQADPKLRQAAAVQVLRAVGLWGLGEPAGETNELALTLGNML